MYNLYVQSFTKLLCVSAILFRHLQEEEAKNFFKTHSNKIGHNKQTYVLVSTMQRVYGFRLKLCTFNTKQCWSHSSNMICLKLLKIVHVYVVIILRVHKSVLPWSKWIPCQLPEDGDIIAPKRVGAMQNARGLNNRIGHLLLSRGFTCQNVVQEIVRCMYPLPPPHPTVDDPNRDWNM